MSLTINPGTPALQIATASLPNATSGVFYSQNLQASGGVQPYNWSLAQGSAGLPPNLILSTNGLISGTPTVTGTNFQFIVQVMDASSNFTTRTLSLSINGGGGQETVRAPTTGAGAFYRVKVGP